MLTIFLLNLLTFAGNMLSSIFGTVDVLPFGTDPYFETAFGWLRSLQDVVWPINVILVCFLAYAGFKVSLILLKLVFGSRAPSSI